MWRTVNTAPGDPFGELWLRAPVMFPRGTRSKLVLGSFGKTVSPERSTHLLAHPLQGAIGFDSRVGSWVRSAKPLAGWGRRYARPKRPRVPVGSFRAGGAGIGRGKRRREGAPL